MRAVSPKKAAHPARWFDPPDAKGRRRCTLCPRYCQLRPGQAGFCFVRQNLDGEAVSLAYGQSIGLAVDPIEKKPLYHFYPGSQILSFGTAGCNLGCKFCQNWTMSNARDVETRSKEMSPQEIVDLAKHCAAPAIALTYNDPIVFAEYAIDVATLAQRQGLRVVAVSNGYINPEPRRDFFAHIDAANIDLKSLSKEFYFRLTGGAQLEPVLDSLRYLVHETSVWLELTTLLIPGKNDSDEDLRALSSWIKNQLHADIPVHFSAFHPAFRLNDLPRTPAATLQRARAIALEAGLNHVYTGNVVDPQGQASYCSACGTLLISRGGYHTEVQALDPQGCCQNCGQALAGRWV